MSIEEGVQSLSLSGPDVEPDAVPFDPDFKLEPIPRYLFRVFTPHSDGSTDHEWVKSKDVLGPNANKDVFKIREIDAAQQIYKHLKWIHFPEDNLMSWTSSLLFAIQYIFYRHEHKYDRSDWWDIKLCIVDTQSYSDVFIRDMDLINSFASHDTCLEQFQKLRNKEFYFGEYLSQGALRIKGKCQIISAQAMINAGLLQLNKWLQYYAGNPTKQWAYPVLNIRNTCKVSWGQPQPIRREQIQKAIDVSHLFEPRFQLPIAINLAAIVNGKMDFDILTRVFRDGGFHDAELKKCNAGSLRIVEYHQMVENGRARIIRDIVYTDYCQSRLEDSLKEARSCFAGVIKHVRQLEGSADEHQRQRLKDSLRKATQLHELTGSLENLLDGASREFLIHVATVAA